MLDFSQLLIFSQSHCLAICAVLVPANLLTTLQTMILTGLNRPSQKIWQAAGFSSLFALTMVLHVMAWFVSGVVMLPSYVLLLLGTVCLSINFWAVFYPRSLHWLMGILGRSLKSLWMRTAISA